MGLVKTVASPLKLVAIFKKPLLLAIVFGLFFTGVMHGTSNNAITPMPENTYAMMSLVQENMQLVGGYYDKHAKVLHLSLLKDTNDKLYIVPFIMLKTPNDTYLTYVAHDNAFGNMEDALTVVMAYREPVLSATQKSIDMSLAKVLQNIKEQTGLSTDDITVGYFAISTTKHIVVDSGILPISTTRLPSNTHLLGVWKRGQLALTSEGMKNKEKIIEFVLNMYEIGSVKGYLYADNDNYYFVYNQNNKQYVYQVSKQDVQTISGYLIDIANKMANLIKDVDMNDIDKILTSHDKVFTYTSTSVLIALPTMLNIDEQTVQTTSSWFEQFIDNLLSVFKRE